MLSIDETRSEVVKLAALCNGMTKDESKFDDDDFSISASKSIIKSPIPKQKYFD